MEKDRIMLLSEDAYRKIEKELAKFHGDHIQQVVQRLPCPVEQKLELIDSVIDQLKEDHTSTT